jgi:hypothetical protein
MDLQQLDYALTLLCVTLRITEDKARYTIEQDEKCIEAFVSVDSCRVNSIPIPKTEDLSYVYWNLSYKLIHEGILELQKAKEIFKQFNIIEA